MAAIAAPHEKADRPRGTWLALVIASVFCPLAVLASGPIAFGIYMANDFDDDSSPNAGNAYLWVLAGLLFVALAGVVTGWTLHTFRRFPVPALIAGIVSSCAAGLIVLLFSAELISVVVAP